MNETLNSTLELTNQTLTNVSQVMGINLPVSGSPLMDIILITLITSLFITLVNKKFSDQVKIKALRAEMKELQKKMRKQMAKDPKKAQALQKKIMEKNMENFKHAFNMKVMMITMIPMMFVFLFLGRYYSVFGEFFTPVSFISWGWLGSYLLFSIVWSIVLKKVLDVA